MKKLGNNLNKGVHSQLGYQKKEKGFENFVRATFYNQHLYETNLNKKIE
jgi:hypothetical protein